MLKRRSINAIHSTRVPGSFGLEGAMIDQALYLSDRLRWVFQIFEGINYVKTMTDNKIECITDTHRLAE